MSAAQKVKSQPTFKIQVIRGPHQGLQLQFSKGSVFIGRGPENDIVLSNDPRTSRQHAEIKIHGQDFVVINLSQKNFILVNGQNVQSEILVQGSVITIGETDIQFHVGPIVQMDVGTQSHVPSQAPLKAVETFGATAGPLVNHQQTNSPTYSPPRALNVPPQHQSIPVFQGAPSAPGPQPAKQSYQTTSRAMPPSDGFLSNPKIRFYAVVAVIGALGWWLFMTPEKKSPKDPNAIRTAPLSMQDVAAAEKRTQELLSVKKEKYDSIQGRRAQENFIKGFRDYQQGQYARAREAFQVVLNLDPENELAKRYFHLSKIKFDELVKFNMIQGNRYREKRNWRMCQSNYSNVMTMLQNRREDPTYKEAKQYYEECTLNLEGRF